MIQFFSKKIEVFNFYEFVFHVWWTPVIDDDILPLPILVEADGVDAVCGIGSRQWECVRRCGNVPVSSVRARVWVQGLQAACGAADMAVQGRDMIGARMTDHSLATSNQHSEVVNKYHRIRACYDCLEVRLHGKSFERVARTLYFEF
jgi:hypothetical protein